MRKRILNTLVVMAMTGALTGVTVTGQAAKDNECDIAQVETTEEQNADEPETEQLEEEKIEEKEDTEDVKAEESKASSKTETSKETTSVSKKTTEKKTAAVTETKKGTTSSKKTSTTSSNSSSSATSNKKQNTTSSSSGSSSTASDKKQNTTSFSGSSSTASDKKQNTTSSGSGSSSITAAHTHNWVATYDDVWVVTKAARTEQVPVYEDYGVVVCGRCKEEFSKPSEWTAHTKAKSAEGDDTHGNWYTDVRQKQVGTKPITYDEEGYWTKEKTGEKCACGATR